MHIQTPIVHVRNLAFSWQVNQRPVLSIDEFVVNAREKVFIKGPSGCGKSTLLSLLGGVISPQRGEINILGKSLEKFSQSERDCFRADHIGFVFQMFNLVPYLSVMENVTLPCRFSVKRRYQAMTQNDIGAEATRILEHLGLVDRTLFNAAATDLSVGQQQRVAVARALLGAPEIIVADEPTSALDTDLRDTFINLLMAECERNDATLLFVSHDGGLAHYFDRVIDFKTINRVH